MERQLYLQKNNILHRLWRAACNESKLTKASVVALNLNDSARSITEWASSNQMQLRIAGSLIFGFARIYARKIWIATGEAEQLMSRMNNPFKSEEGKDDFERPRALNPEQIAARKSNISIPRPADINQTEQSLSPFLRQGKPMGDIEPSDSFLQDIEQSLGASADDLQTEVPVCEMDIPMLAIADGRVSQSQRSSVRGNTVRVIEDDSIEIVEFSKFEDTRSLISLPASYTPDCIALPDLNDSCLDFYVADELKRFYRTSTQLIELKRTIMGDRFVESQVRMETQEEALVPVDFSAYNNEVPDFGQNLDAQVDEPCNSGQIPYMPYADEMSQNPMQQLGDRTRLTLEHLQNVFQSQKSTQSQGYFSFDKLSHNSDRKHASIFFSELMVLANKDIVQLSQEEPLSDLKIKPSVDFNQY